MKLTALEIKQQKFETSFRGYDPAEVQAFLSLMSNEWEHMVSKNRELLQQIDDLQEKLKHYERVEEALHETLQAAKDTAETRTESATKEARHTIEKAEMQAETIIKDAKRERREMRQGIQRLLDRRKEIIGGIRSYLQVAKESVDEFEKDRAKLFEHRSELEETETDFDSPGNTQESTAAENEETSAHRKTKDAHTSPPGAEDIENLVDDLE
jgi:cell division initiation protein